MTSSTIGGGGGGGGGTLDHSVCCQTVLDLPQQFTKSGRGLKRCLQTTAAAWPCAALAT